MSGEINLLCVLLEEQTIIQVGDKSGRKRVSKESLTGSPSSSLSPAPRLSIPNPHLGLISTLAPIFPSPPLSESLEQARVDRPNNLYRCQTFENQTMTVRFRSI